MKAWTDRTQTHLESLVLLVLVCVTMVVTAVMTMVVTAVMTVGVTVGVLAQQPASKRVSLERRWQPVRDREKEAETYMLDSVSSLPSARRR